jgi:hypothetical protein
MLPALEQAAGAARAISRQGQSTAVQVMPGSPYQHLYPAIDPAGQPVSESVPRDRSDHQYQRRTKESPGQ